MQDIFWFFKKFFWRFTIDVLQKDKKTSDEWEILCYS